MSIPELYVSIPGVAFPDRCYGNDDIMKLVQNEYKGPAKEWSTIESAILRVFEKCNTQHRYLDFNPTSRVAEYAVRAVHDCFAKNGTALEAIANEIDLVIFGGIAREYFEPATAMEVSNRLGLREVHAFDVTTACVGHLEALQAACAYLTMHEHYRTALLCTAELSRDFLSFDIQSTRDLYLKAAGLTIGNAASCMLLKRTPWKNGCMRVISTDTFSLPDHWDLCQVPIHGAFTSSSVELMKTHRYIAPRVKKVLKRLGWRPEDVQHFIFHQPSELMTKKIITAIGAEENRGVYTHHLYGNNASATVGVVWDQLLKEREMRAGDKMVLGSAASGFTMMVAFGEWVSGE